MTANCAVTTRRRLVIPKRDKDSIGSPTNSNTNETNWGFLGWNKLRSTLDQIFQHQTSQLSFAEIYKLIYELVEGNQGERVYIGLSETLQEYVEAAKARILLESNSTYLQSILNEWKQHRENLLLIRSLFFFVDRVHVPITKAPPVFELGVQIFGQSLFQDSQVLFRFQSLIMEQIRQERDHENVMDKLLIKNIVQMLMEIDLKMYIQCLENHLLEQTHTYYRSLAQQVSEISSVPDYFRYVLVRLSEERERADNYFIESTRTQLEDVIKYEMIHQYDPEKEASGVVEMLRQWNLEDLQLVYRVRSLVEGGMTRIVVILNQFATAEGVAICKSSGGNPIELVENAARLLEKYEHMILASFQSRNEFGVSVPYREVSGAIKKALDDSINANPAFPEYLSRYLDSKLKREKFQSTETDFDTALNRVISLFRHVKDKDVFETCCKTHLALRLLEGRNASDEAEHAFISKLKNEFGHQFTSKLEGMFQDMKHSQELMVQFKQSLLCRPVSDLSVHVLTTGWWPGTSTVNCHMPYALQEAGDLFRTFYLSIHTSRKLMWQFNRGTADLCVSFPRKRHEINVSTYQMLILLLFNDAPCLTFERIVQQTAIPAFDVQLALASLCATSKSHSPLVISSDSTNIHKFSQFRINEDFSSKLLRVKISPAAQIQSIQTQTETLAQVSEDRKWQVDAVIVRIMKTRKTEEHRQLVLDVTQQLQARFLPSLDLIKRRIESLIEREYMDRAPDSRTQYVYLA